MQRDSWRDVLAWLLLTLVGLALMGAYIMATPPPLP